MRPWRWRMSPRSCRAAAVIETADRGIASSSAMCSCVRSMVLPSDAISHGEQPPAETLTHGVVPMADGGLIGLRQEQSHQLCELALSVVGSGRVAPRNRRVRSRDHRRGTVGQLYGTRAPLAGLGLRYPVRSVRQDLIGPQVSSPAAMRLASGRAPLTALLMNTYQSNRTRGSNPPTFVLAKP